MQALLTGLGTDHCVAVETDPATGAMDVAALRQALRDVSARGDIPFFVGATAGTTVRGAFDPLGAIADACAAHGAELGHRPWLHVDAAWGGAALFSARPERRALLAGADRADSLCWNAHKLMGAPLQTSAFVTPRRRGALAAANSTSADYLFQAGGFFRGAM